MSPCCLAAATALIAVGLSAFVLASDGFGLVVLLGTTPAASLRRLA